MDIQLEQNPFKTLFIQTAATVKVYLYAKTETKGTYRFFYTAEGGLGSLIVDLSKVDMSDTEKFAENEAIPSFIDFSWIDGAKGTKQLIKDMLVSLVTKITEKLNMPLEKKTEPEEITYKVRYEETQKLNNRLLEIIDKKING